jgi:PAS domain S-box-containing protein
MAIQSIDESTDFRSLVDHLDRTAVWIVAESGEFEYVSDGIEDIWGIPADEIERDPSLVLEGMHSVDRERVRASMQQSPEAVTEEEYEARVIKTDGTVRWTHTRMIPVRDDDGELVNIAGITTDITEQKRREKEFEALNRILRHDVRNDLSVILGWGELLEEHVDDEGAAYLEKILGSANHVVELTAIARDYAETIAGDDEMLVRPMSLHEVLSHEIELRREFFSEAEFDVVGEIPDVDVVANEMLSSVFRNLLSNAVQHNDEETPVVEISVEVLDQTVAISIADNGPGIAEEVRSSLFEEGNKGIESSGTGMGLYLVKTLVEQYGGEVSIRENSPKGTVFEVELHRAE